MKTRSLKSLRKTRRRELHFPSRPAPVYNPYRAALYRAHGQPPITHQNGTREVVSGCANYNGGVRFFPVFRPPVERGGKRVAIFGGRAQQNLTSRQGVRELFGCGADVPVINRKRLMPVKSDGSKTHEGEMLVVTSGNLTGPGMAQNVEMALLLNRPTTRALGFSWEDMISSRLEQPWDSHRPELNNISAPAWKLLSDEEAATIVLDETDEVTMRLRLGDADTIRINAESGTLASKGTQYCWLSKDCDDFFPALTILNPRGSKKTYACKRRMNFVDLNQEHPVRVTFEGEHTRALRRGPGPLRGAGLAAPGDRAARSRAGESRYERRLSRRGTGLSRARAPHAVKFLGPQGQRYGFISNQDFERVIGGRMGERKGRRCSRHDCARPLPEGARAALVEGPRQDALFLLFRGPLSTRHKR